MGPSLADKAHRGETHGRAPFKFSYLILLVLVTWAGVFSVRLLGPPNLLDNDQQRPAAYTLDLLNNGNYLVQRDDTHDITSKPPLYTWIVATTAIVYGRLDDFSLYLPGALSVAAAAVLVLFLGWKPFGPLAAFLGAVACLLSSAGFKQVHLARTDPLFSLTVFGTAVVGVLAARGKVSWVWFWVGAALSTLAKTPLGPVLSAGALFGMIGLPKSTTQRRDGVLKEHLIGVTVFLILAAGWFLIAWITVGHDLIVKLIDKELVGHAVESASGQKPFEGIYKPSLYFLSRFLPWSVFTFLGLIRVIAIPAKAPEERLLERALTAYFLFGLLVFSISPHQRWDHLFPLLPAAGLLAGREIVRLIPAPHQRRLALGYPVLLLVVLGASWAYLEIERNSKVQRTILCKDAAGYIRDSAGSQFPVMHVDSTMGVQYYLGTMRRRVPHKLAREALLSDRAAYVLLQDEEDFLQLLPNGLGSLYEVKDWTEKGRSYPFMRLIGNRPELAPQDKMMFFLEGLELETDGVRVLELNKQELSFEANGESPSSVLIRNISTESRSIEVSILKGGSTHFESRRLKPQEDFTFAPD